MKIESSNSKSSGPCTFPQTNALKIKQPANRQSSIVTPVHCSCTERLANVEMAIVKI